MLLPSGNFLLQVWFEC